MVVQGCRVKIEENHNSGSGSREGSTQGNSMDGGRMSRRGRGGGHEDPKDEARGVPLHSRTCLTYGGSWRTFCVLYGNTRCLVNKLD